MNCDVGKCHSSTGRTDFSEDSKGWAAASLVVLAFALSLQI